MSRFTNALHVSVPRPCFGRPFVCDGHPENCRAVVIGENPSTEMGADWWSYWDDSKGFDYGAWKAAYENTREKKGKSRVSNTRARLNRLRSGGVQCLETNVFFNERPNG